MDLLCQTYCCYSIYCGNSKFNPIPQDFVSESGGLRFPAAVDILLDMTTTVRVTTGARLHFGPLAAGGVSGGRFGGVGMMVASPGYVLAARISEQDECHGEDAVCQRVLEFIRRIRDATCQDRPVPPVSVEIEKAIAAHSGLGSGTQLGLAVASAVACLSGESNVAVEALARRAGRGLRSAIGLYGFARGGILIDGGRSGSGQLGTLVSRLDFPEAWRLILVSPPDSAGLSGSAEQTAFASQPSMPESLTGELCRIALMEWLPGLIEADFVRVSNAMYDYGHAVGQFFQPVQGGVFAHPQMSELAGEVRRRRHTGVAQTSWGPTTCILCEDAASATALAADLAKDARFTTCRFQVTEALNRGAFVETR